MNLDRTPGCGRLWAILVLATALAMVVMAPAQANTDEGRDLPSSTEPVPTWVDQFGESSAVWLQDVATDGGGRVYTVGQSRQQRGGENWFVGYVRATSASGVELWVDEFGEPGSAIARSVAVTDDGHLATVGDRGDRREPEQDSVGFVRTYDPDGQMKWMRDLAGTLTKHPEGVAAGPDGTVYVVGRTSGSQRSSGFLLAYSPSGDELWIKRLPSVNGVAAVAVGRDGTVYVTGNTSETLSGQTGHGGRDGFVRAYSPSGRALWTDQFGTEHHDYAFGIDVGPSGSVHILGSSAFTHGFARAYSAEGALSWHTRWSDEHDMSWSGLAVDAAGVTYVAGDVIVEPEFCSPHCTPAIRDASILALSETGDVIWTTQFGTDGNDETAGLAAPGPATLVVAGLTDGVFPSQVGSPDTSAFLMKLSPPRCRGLAATVLGSASGGTVTGTAGPDVIVGGIGDDTIQGLAGDDVICGGTGNDTIFAGGGVDTILGQRGDDIIRGGDGDDLVAGNGGADRIVGNGGSDVLRAGTGDDHLNGGSGPDELHGAGGDDRIFGSGGDDDLVGGTGRDKIVGGNGDDRLRGSFGGDVLQGRAGDDHLDGGPGQDRCNGAPGSDTVTRCESVPAIA